MAIRVNPKLIGELEIYGAEDVSKCYHCGNCSATCPFSKTRTSCRGGRCARCRWASRRSSRATSSPGSATTAASARRTMPARRRARRDHDEPAPLAHLALRLHGHLARLLPLRPHRAPVDPCRRAAQRPRLSALRLLAGQPGATTTAPTPSCPAPSIHIFDWTLAGVLLTLLLTNCGRMWWFTIGRDKSTHISLLAYVTTHLPATAALLHAETHGQVRAQAALGHPPCADAELRDDARADHVLFERHGLGAGG